MKKKKVNSKKLCDSIIEGMQDNKAKNIVLLDLRKIESAVCSYFIICSGESNTQVEGIQQAVVRNTRKNLKEKPWHIEGKTNAEWILLDYVDVVVHIFYKGIREFYDLEDLWADAIKKEIPDEVTPILN
ncbi:MAG: ribosome silencing factor [Flavobacteriia bacterium]|nr:ribosome silencing factor [Flavobacteriia bacterium]